MLNEAMQKALASEVVRPVVAAEIEWPDENMRAHTGVGDLYLNTSKVWTPNYDNRSYIEIPPWKVGSVDEGLYRDFSISGEFICNNPYDQEGAILDLPRSGETFAYVLLRKNRNSNNLRFYYNGSGIGTNIENGCRYTFKMSRESSGLTQLFLNDQLVDERNQNPHRDNDTEGTFWFGRYGNSYLSGQLHNVKLTDNSNPENSRYYPSIIRSPTQPDTLTLKDEWGDGSTDGELIGFPAGNEWEEVKGYVPGDTLFHGVGDIGSISAIKQSSGDSPTRLTLGLSAFDDSVRGEALRAKYHGRPVTVWLVALNEQHQPMANQVIWKGSIVDARVSIGDSNQIEVTVSNRLEDWDKKRPDRFTDESQQARHKGDSIFRYIPIMAEWPIYWGSDKQATPLRDSL